MSKLNIFVCQNYVLEFEAVLKEEGFADVFIVPFLSMCEDRSDKAGNQDLLQSHTAADQTNVVLCSHHCDINQLIPSVETFTVRQAQFCFNHLAGDHFIREIIDEGGYIIGLYWLKHWQRHIEALGFNHENARIFYQEFAKKLVFFDGKIDSDAKAHLQELSAFLDIPYVMISLDLKFIAILLRSLVYEWRLHEDEKKNKIIIKDIQCQCAESAAILDLMGKIASFTNKLDTIQKIKEIFMLVLGAQSFKYWNQTYEQDELSSKVKSLLESNDQTYAKYEPENRFYIKLKHDNHIFGVFEVGDFIFPQYFEKYLNFAIEIGKISSLVLANIDQYEKLMQSENELQYLSYHDGLTGLYNRNYINNFLNENMMKNFLTIFMFDIDGLKVVNDTFGHLEGDKLISGVSLVLKKCFREKDIVARIGGDEFMAILPDCEAEMAELFKKRLETMLLEYNESIPEDYLKLSVSSGFAVAENKVKTIESLMQKADELMYQEKRNRKNHLASRTVLAT